MGPSRFRCRVGLMVFACCLIGQTGTATAHDIPNARIERSTQVVLATGQLRVEYEVVLAELTLAQDLRQLDGESFVGDRAALFERYARVVGPLNARGFLVQVDEQAIDLQAVGFTIAVEDHPRFRFQFEAKIPNRGRLILADTNYVSSEGATRLALEVAPQVAAVGDLPPPRVESIPLLAPWQRTDTDDRRAQRLTLDYTPRLAVIGPAERSPTTLSSVSPPPRASSGLTRLLDARSGFAAVGWWITAFVLGMVHAIQPGHGKTLVAAASLDGPDSAFRGVGLGLITAACHLAGVVALAAVLWAFPTDRFGSIHVAVARTSGALIAAVGLFRAGRHLAGIAPDHLHRDRSNAGVWSLGLAAGFVPCWDAVALVVLAQSIGRLGWGLGLLVAFSLGLAVVLVCVGWVAGRLHRRVTGGIRSQGTQRWLGLASGLVLGAIGIGLLGS